MKKTSLMLPLFADFVNVSPLDFSAFFHKFLCIFATVKLCRLDKMLRRKSKPPPGLPGSGLRLLFCVCFFSRSFYQAGVAVNSIHKLGYNIQRPHIAVACVNNSGIADITGAA